MSIDYCAPAARQVPEECPAAIAKLIEDCMERPPHERPSARQAYDVIRGTSAAPAGVQQARGWHSSAKSHCPAGAFQPEMREIADCTPSPLGHCAPN